MRISERNEENDYDETKMVSTDLNEAFRRNMTIGHRTLRTPFGSFECLGLLFVAHFSGVIWRIAMEAKALRDDPARGPCESVG